MKKTTKKRPYVILRCTQAGVHAGEILERTRTHVVLTVSRRIWDWVGAETLSEIAVYGCNPDRASESHVAPVVDRIEIPNADICEIIHCQPEGEAWIRGAATWRA